MSAKTQIVGEWTPWSGGSRPCMPDQRVHVHFRSGVEAYDMAHRLEWRHEGGFGDIVAYAVHIPYVMPAWRAKGEELFWIVGSDGTTQSCVEDGCSKCDAKYAIGNYYQTEALATAAAQRVLNAYKGEAA